MQLLTLDLQARLLANGAALGDHLPVVKFFSPLGAATWLFSELDADGDVLFGLCDLGFGCPELGSASLSEIAGVRLPLGLGIERDIHFAPTHPLTVYAEAARRAGRITEHPARLAELNCLRQIPAR
jgi:hypothetical protein